MIANENRKEKFCNKCNTITPHNGNICLVCNPKSKSASISYLIFKENKFYYFDTIENNYIEWNVWKEKFKIQNSNIDIIKNLEKDYNIKIIPTFRKQNSMNWTNAKIPFEKSLIELNLNYFVYIKFYINNKNEILPLVVGKSGIFNVNYSGSDISFSEDINHGPARRFLKETNKSWDKTKIAIIKCKNEQEAYKIENEIAIKYNLFKS